MEGRRAAWPAAVEWKREEDVRRHAGEGQLLGVAQAELVVIVRVPDQAAAPRPHRLQPREALADQRLADALPLICR